MRNVTTKFKQLLSQNKRNYINSLNITLADGTQLNVANDNIMDGGLDVDDAVSQDNEFTALGSTIVGSCNVILYDITEKYSDYDFLNARVVVKTNLYGADSSDLITFGTYTVDSATYSESSVSLTLLDNMCQFDREYTSYSIYTSTTTLRDIVYDACTKCGVLYDSSMSSFPNYNFVVPQAPKDDCTYREVIGWCATLAGCFARMTSDGKLKFDWFNVDAFAADEALSTDGGIFDSANPYATGDNVNGGTFNPWNDPSSKDGGAFTDRNGIHYLASLSTQNIDVDDVVITGIQVTYDVEEDNSTTQETALLGTDDYVVSITGNPFITESNYQSVLSFLQPTLIGLTFRPCNITIPNNPTIEAGDIGYVWDTKGIQHRILITRATFNPSELQNVVCGAESPGKNSSGRLTSVTKAFAKSRRMLNEEKSIREQIVEDFQRQIANGSGLYFTRVATGSSEIIYGHDKPTLAESKVVLKVSTAGIAMTGDYTGNDSTTTWYGQTFDGTWLANIISTMNLFFDYAHGGTLKLGGDNNINGLLEIYAADGTTKIGTWGKDGLFANTGGKITSKNGKVYFDLDNNELACSKLISTGTQPYKVDVGSITSWQGNTVNGVRIAQASSEQNGLTIRPVTSTSEYCVMETPTWLRIVAGNATGTTKNYGTLLLGQYNVGLYRYITQSGVTSGYGYVIDSDGDLDISSPRSLYFTIATTVNVSANRVELPVSNKCYCGSSQIATVSSSSRRYKHNIKPLSENREAHKLLELPVVEFEWNEDHELQYEDMRGKVVPGIIAEDIAEIYPSAVIHKPDTGEIESWDERRIIPGMLALIQEQDKKLKDQENQINDLKSRLEKMERVIMNLINDGR